jgi:hypothetical protein
MWLIILFVLEEIKVKMQVILEILYLCLFLFLSENEIYMLISVILPFNILNFMDYTTIKPLQELLVLFVFCLFRKFNSHFQSSRINKKKKKKPMQKVLSLIIIIIKKLFFKFIGKANASALCFQ